MLAKYNVELLGAKLPSINRAEDRSLFRDAMVKIGLKTPASGIANTWEEALQARLLDVPPRATAAAAGCCWGCIETGANSLHSAAGDLQRDVAECERQRDAGK